MSGMPAWATVSRATVSGIALASALVPVGQWGFGDDSLTRIAHNTLWSQVSNLYSIPTDCPQRDEVSDGVLNSGSACVLDVRVTMFSVVFMCCTACCSGWAGLPMLTCPWRVLFACSTARRSIGSSSGPSSRARTRCACAVTTTSSAHVSCLCTPSFA